MRSGRGHDKPGEGRGIRETLAVANAGEWLVRLVAGLGVRLGGQRGMIKQALTGMETEQCGTVWWGGLGKIREARQGWTSHGALWGGLK